MITVDAEEMMIPDTIAEIQRKLQQTGNVPPQTRQELLGLLDTLKTEIAELSKTDAEHARSIAGLTETYTQEATRDERNPELLDDAVTKLTESVEGFENSHPRLVEAINRIATTLSGLGI